MCTGSGMENAVQLVEQACQDLQIPARRPSAEAFLLAFRKSAHPLGTCREILDNSKNPLACFHAAATLQEVAVRDWLLLGAEEQSGLKNYCFYYAMHMASEPYVRAKMLAAVAVLLKRGWLESSTTERDSFLNGVKHVALAGPNPAAQLTAIALLEAVVMEFSPSTASALGLPAEFHERCKLSLETDYLQKIYSVGQDAAVASAAGAINGAERSPEGEICASALHLMSQVLSWSFKRTGVQPGGPGRLFSAQNGQQQPDKLPAGTQGTAGVTPVCPGTAWRDLLSLQRKAWLLEFYRNLRQQKIAAEMGGGRWIDSRLALSSRTLLVQFCSLTGDIFASDGEATQEAHLSSMAAGVMSWLSPPDAIVAAVAAGGSESELLQGCQMLTALATIHPTQAFEHCLVGRARDGLVGLLAAITCKVISAGGARDDAKESWSGEALDILLEAWMGLLEPACCPRRRVPAPQGVLEAATGVFQTYVESELGAAAAAAHDEDDSTERMRAATSARDERLAAVATLGRASPMSTLPMLAGLLSERTSRLKQCFVAGVDPTVVLEELHWLLLMCGHILADSGEGETPLIPESILRASAEASASGAIDPGVSLSSASLELAFLSLDAEARTRILSPRLMEAVVWLLARWMGTYLMPEPASVSRAVPLHPGNPSPLSEGQSDTKAGIMEAFGEGGGAVRVLEAIVPVAFMALTQWVGESDLQEMVCRELLPALVKRKRICRVIVTMDAWRQLAEAFARWQPPLSSLAIHLQRAVAQALIQAVVGINGAERSDQYVADLMRPVVIELTTITQQQGFISAAQRPDISVQVASLLARMRGSARGSMPRSQKVLFSIGVAVSDPLLTLLQAYRDEPAMVYMVLKYVVEWVESQVAFLEPQETAILFRFCLRLLQIYSANNIGKVSLHRSASLASENQSEKYKDLRVLLLLLSHLSSKDMIDFGTTAVVQHDEDASVSQVVYLGLHIIIPLISVELLKYPKLCLQYFTLLSHMLEVYPEKVAVLPAEAFTPIISTLDFGLRHQDLRVVVLSLNALSGLATFHFNALSQNQPGLGHFARGGQGLEGGGQSQDGVLAHFLRMLFNLLLLDDYSVDMIDSAADALLPVLFCEQSLYQSLAEGLLSGQRDAEVYQRLASAFHMLLTSNQITRSLDRANRRRFRKNLHTFLSNVRSLLRTK